MSPSFLLFAGPADFFQFGAFIFVIVVAIIRFLASMIKEAQEAKQQAPKESPAQEKLQAEIDQFLRETEEKRTGGKPANPKPRPAIREQQGREQQGREQQPQRNRQAGSRQQGQRSKNGGRQTAPPPPPQPQLVKAQLAPQALIDRPSMDQQVQAHLNAGKFAQRAADLTHLPEEEQEFAQNIEHNFDHQLGRLSTTNSSGGKSGSGTGRVNDTASLSPTHKPLLNLAQLRNAILLSEILHRPEERW